MDFWRGLCLIDMLLVHLVHQGMTFGRTIDLWMGEYTRFAAGGFVLIAGLSIGRIFLPRVLDDAKRWQTYRALWRRSLVILLVHYVAEIGYLTMCPLFDGAAVPHLRRQIWMLLTLRAGYDLLPFYVIMVALAPLMLELVRRRLGWVLALVSVGLFTLGQFTDPWKLALPNQTAFLPSLWQLFFVGGVVLAPWLDRYDRLSYRAKVGLAIAASAGQLVMFLAQYGPNFGVYLWLPMAYTKVPLATGEVLRYVTLVLAIVFISDLIWKRRLQESVVSRFSELLGRHSLPIFVFHVWVVSLLVRATTWLEPAVWVRLLMAAGGLAMMAWFASLLDQKKSRKKSIKAAPAPDAGRTPAAHPAKRLPFILSPWRHVGGMTALAITTLAIVVSSNVQQRQLSARRARHAPARFNEVNWVAEGVARNDDEYSEDNFTDMTWDSDWEPDVDDDATAESIWDELLPLSNAQGSGQDSPLAADDGL